MDIIETLVADFLFLWYVMADSGILNVCCSSLFLEQQQYNIFLFIYHITRRGGLGGLLMSGVVMADTRYDQFS